METIEERAFKAYPKPKLMGSSNILYDFEANSREGYIKACEEYESLPKIHGWWVARDENGDLWAYEMKPSRFESTWWDRDYSRLSLDNDDFPEITWESEPVEVELLIRKV